MNSAPLRLDDRGRRLNPFICSSSELASALQETCDWFTGVPDSMFRKVQPLLEPYLTAPRENHAIASAFGARLGGKRPCVMMQNSGLGLCGDALYGLFHLYGMGVLLLITWRGELEWEEPQHQHWGQRTLEYLSVLDVPVFDVQTLGLGAIAEASRQAYVENRVAAVLLHRGNIDE